MIIWTLARVLLLFPFLLLFRFTRHSDLLGYRPDLRILGRHTSVDEVDEHSVSPERHGAIDRSLWQYVGAVAPTV